VFGKSTNHGDVYAAKSLIRKAVFYVGNVNKECSNNDSVSFVKGMNVNAFSCFEIKPQVFFFSLSVFFVLPVW